MDRMDRRFDRLEADLGPIKGAHARDSAIRNSFTIARKMNLNRVRNLTDEDLFYLVNVPDGPALGEAEAESFCRADLVMETTDSNQETCYLVMEVSFTADQRDTNRAIRNAEIITRFTGKSAYPAIAAIRLDDRIQNQVDSGQVFWYELDASELEAE